MKPAQKITSAELLEEGQQDPDHRIEIDRQAEPARNGLDDGSRIDFVLAHRHSKQKTRGPSGYAGFDMQAGDYPPGRLQTGQHKKKKPRWRGYCTYFWLRTFSGRTDNLTEKPS